MANPTGFESGFLLKLETLDMERFKHRSQRVLIDKKEPKVNILFYKWPFWSLQKSLQRR